ncbi:unnamed protein product [Urochloa humidicola]
MHFHFRDGEIVAEFTNGVTAILCDLGEEMMGNRVLKKVLCMVPKKLKQVAMAIETLVDLHTMMIEELVGCLHTAKDANAEELSPANFFSLRHK